MPISFHNLIQIIVVCLFNKKCYIAKSGVKLLCDNHLIFLKQKWNSQQHYQKRKCILNLHINVEISNFNFQTHFEH